MLTAVSTVTQPLPTVCLTRVRGPFVALSVVGASIACLHTLFRMAKTIYIDKTK